MSNIILIDQQWIIILSPEIIGLYYRKVCQKVIEKQYKTNILIIESKYTEI